jgi:hypothetical protein
MWGGMDLPQCISFLAATGVKFPDGWYGFLELLGMEGLEILVFSSLTTLAFGTAVS